MPAGEGLLGAGNVKRRRGANAVVLGAGLLAVATLVAVAMTFHASGARSGSALELLRRPARPGARLAEIHARWLAEARAARAAGREREAWSLAAQRRLVERRSLAKRRKLAKLALVSQVAQGSPSADRAAAEEGREFDAWTMAWHQKHPGASLAMERAAWRARQGELSRIAAWEARQERREIMKAEKLGEPKPVDDVQEAPASVGAVEPVVGVDSASPLEKRSASTRTGSSQRKGDVPADMFRCVAQIERGVRAVKASGASSSDIISAVRGEMRKRNVSFNEVESALRAHGVSLDDVATIVKVGSFADMQRVMAEKNVDLQGVSKILEQHDITCTDVANIIKSIHSTKVRSDDAEEEKSAEAPSEGGGETQEDDAPAENSDTPGSEPGAEAVVETDETSTPGAHIETPAEEGGDEEEEEGGEQEEEGAKTHAHETQAEQGPAVSEEEEGDSAGAVKHAPSAADGEHVAQEEEREAPAVREERVEEEVEKGIMDNVAEEEGEEGEELAGPTPQERIARARRLIADGGSGGSDPLAERADYLEHRAYWSHARAHMDEEPCTPATFWYGGSLDPRPRCIKPAPSLPYETPKALPPAPVAEPLEDQEAAGRVAEPTVLGVPDGPPDFNGAEAVIAHHPFMGWQPTDLEERGGETRGSFSVVSAPSGFDNEGEVQLAIYGPPKTPIGCKIRGYRKLSGDFQGNVVSTGFLQEWSSAAGEIQTGPISPGVANEYDILTCRDQENGEVQHFRLSWGSAGFNDMKGHGPVRVLGPHTGMNVDSVTFDMDRPTFEDQRAIDDYYTLNYDPATDDKPFSSGRLE